MLGKLNVRASIQDVTRAIKSAGIPKQITQQPFDHDPSHYHRLCRLNGNDPSGSDLLDYALDMQYMELQPELLRYLTPTLLTAWRKDLFGDSAAGYAGFVEQFWPALMKGKALNESFSEVERIAFIAFLRNSILDRLDVEESLHFSGMGAAPYRWVSAFVCYGTLFSDVKTLWTEWWEMKTPGHAIAAFQYSSALMYEENLNPIFEAWTRDKGGGPPPLWECGAMIFGLGWKQANLDFFKDTLSANYFEQKLQLASSRIKNEDAKKVASRIVDDFSGQRTRLDLRIEQLLDLLTDVSGVKGFQV